jgi:hypothetical protein
MIAQSDAIGGSSMTKEPTRQELADELQLIRAQQLQLQKQGRDLGYAVARVSRQLLELSPPAPRLDARQLR